MSGPDTARGPRRRRPAHVRALTLVAALVLAGGAAAGAVALTDRQDAAPAAMETDTGTGATPSAPVVPDGYRLVSDTAGFALAVPENWERLGEEDHQVTYANEAGNGLLLKVRVVADAPYTSYENFKALERDVDAGRRNYRRIELAANTFRGRPGARWEYTYESKDGVTIRAVDQSYIAANGTEYAVHVTQRDMDWAGAREIFDTALSTWLLNDVD
ncbi:hypothetical protein [Streptomyces sp. NBC_00525]|uniref:hypothetical protein n=1 Tax=Streptomyces sp. NBC_00525 TaxID=2903660 RepID=UPI002E80EE84|nr:hypothetical protein [Streptomyces sp. NBC_00525]WUC95282.1 hypothetical protein OG710_17565 [Streptomyces sp. NBC_00525]